MPYIKVPAIEPLEARIAPAVLTITPLDVSKDEGSAGGTTSFSFKVSLDVAEPQDVTVVASLVDGTAKLVDGDFGAFSQTITIPRGQLETIFTVPIRQDATIEADETFSVDLSSPSINAVIGGGSATSTIKNDDFPKLSIKPVGLPIFEGTSLNGFTDFGFEVELDKISETDVKVLVSTKDGTAKAGDGDFTAIALQEVTIPAGQTKASVIVKVRQDSLDEGSGETFSVELSSPTSNALIGTGTASATITDDDPPILTIENATVVEGADGQRPKLVFTAKLSAPSTEAVTFQWNTISPTSVPNGTALAGTDYVAVGVTTVTIAAGETTATFEVEIIGDNNDELGETLKIAISNAKVGTANLAVSNASNEAVGTILNDELTVTLSGQGSVVEGNTGSTNANYTLSLGQGVTSTHPVTVELEFVNKSATAGNDFNLPPSTFVTIPAGASSQNFIVPIRVDSVYEGEETFEVRIKSVTNAVPGALASVETTIVDDDEKPTLTISDITTVEGNGESQVSLTVSLSKAAGTDVTFDWSTLNGTALAGLDFTAVANQQGKIAAGQLSTTLVLTKLGDKVFEKDEKFSVVLKDVVNAALPEGAATATATVTLTNDEEAPKLSIADAQVFEGEGANPRLGFVVSITNDVTSDQDIQFDWVAALGTATPGVDYTTVTPSAVTIPAGQTSVTLFLNVNDDASNELDETVLATIGGAKYADGTPVLDVTKNQATGHILNDDLAVSIAPLPDQPGGSNSVVEGAEEGTFITRYRISIPSPSAHDVRVTVQVDEASIAKEGTDFTFLTPPTVTIPAGQTFVDFEVTIKGDSSFETNEALTLELINPVNAEIGTGTATKTITNDDPAPRIRIDDQRVYEGQDGNTVMSFTVRLTNALGEDVTASEDVTFQWSTLSGTAIAGIDFSNVTSRTATISKDTTSATITVALSGDAIDEVDETFLVELSNAMLGETPITIDDAQATGTILNDDTSLRITNASVTEGNTGTTNLEFAVSIGQISAHDVTVTFEVTSGTARTGNEEGSGPADYNLPTEMTVTIPAGQTVGTISIPILGDTVHEQNETLVVKLKDSTNAKIVVDSATGTIINDDAAPTISVADKTFVEGDSGTTTVEFTLTLTEAAGQDVTVLVTPTGGTALLGSDFTAETKTVTIKAGETSAKYELFINGDATFENDESFTVILSNATGAVIGKGVGAGSIPNVDEKPQISISDAAQGENTGSLTFTITLDVASGLPVTFTAATVASIGAGAATAGTDYTSKTQNFTIPAGQTSATFAVAIGNDALFEADETFTVQLSNILGATALNPTGTGKIVNDDRVPTISATGVTVVEGDSLSKEVEVVVSLSSLAGSDVTFDWQAIAGTAAGQDFTAISTSPMTILAGQSTARIKFSITGDMADEVDESFQVKISNVQVNGSPLAPSNDTAIVKILNDDLSVSVDDLTVVENDPEIIQEDPEILSKYVDAVFTIRLSGPSLHPVTVNYATQDGTAISTADAEHRDFESLTGSVTFDPGDTEKTVTVKVLRDQNFDGTDQFKLLLTSVENARIADGEAAGTITDDDDAQPAITIDTIAAIAEDAGTRLTPPTPGVSKLEFTVRLDHASDEVVEVYVSTVDGTAVAGSDFTGITKQKVTFAPGELSKTVTVNVLNDATYEADQSFKLALSDPAGGTLGAASEQTATIESEDVEPTLQVTGHSILEGNNGERFLSFVVQRTGATDESISFRFSTLDGTIPGASAVGGSDFEAKNGEEITMAPGESSKTVMVRVLTDAVDERDEQFQVQISDLDGADYAEGTDGKATGTIFNDDLIVSLSQGTVQVAEGNSGQADMVFTVNLSSVSTHATEVTYTIGGGTATVGTDYLAPTPLTIIIPAGASTGQIRIPILGDATAEPAETLTVTLTGAKDAELGASDLVATGTILNDDAALSISNGRLVEGATGTAMMKFTVTLDAPFAYPVTVNYATANDTATAGSDYTNTQGTLTFGVNETSKDIFVPILGDTAVEGDETFKLTLSNANGASILAATATGTIQDDESAFSISDATLDEGDAGTRTMTFTVTRAPGSSVNGTVRVSTQDGTAVSTGPNLDFVAKSEVITFAANETTKTFTVVVNSDTVFEVGQETFSVVLSDATAGVIADGQATGTITNGADAVPTISIGDATVLEGNSGTKALKFTVSLSAASEFPVSFDFATALSASGIAANATDFTAHTQTYIIPAGQRTFDVEVQVNGDTTPEADEVLLGQITGATVTPPGQQTATALTITDREAAGTIRNDDSTVSIVTTASGSEGNGPGSTITVRITLYDGDTEINAPVDIPVTLQFAGGTATIGTDFTLPEGMPPLTATIPAGQKFVDVIVPIIGDNLDEADETFTVTVTPTAHALAGSTSSTVTITDDDSAPTITVANVSVVEGNSAAFKVILSEASGRDVIVKWMTEYASGTASEGDFGHSATVQTLVIPAGQTTGTITISTTNDTLDELDETFKLRILASTENAAVPQDIFATATIEKNDLGTYSIADASVTEGATGTKTLSFTVTRTASNLPGSVKYTTSDDSAKASTSAVTGDFESKSGETIHFLPGETSKTIEITINGDATSEVDERFFVTLSDEENGTLARKTATGTILNDEVTYRIERVDTDNPFTEEKTGSSNSQQIARFRIIREGAAGSLVNSGTVSYTTGTNPTAGALQATAGTDYTVKSGTVSFTAQGATATRQESDIFEVLITPDSLTEGGETFAFKLSNAVNGQISTLANEGEQVVTIVDNDADKLPSITISNGKIVEGADGVTSEMVFKVKLVDSDGDAQSVAGAVTVSYSTADLPGALTARAGQDYLAAAENAFLTFAAGETEKEIRIPILGDSVDEIDETFSVEIDGAVFKVPGSSTEIAFASTKLPDPATGTITNDDLTVTLDPLSSAFEGNGPGQIEFVARLSQPSTHAVTFKIKTQDGTAKSGTTDDFIGVVEQLVTIEAGQTTKTFTIAVNGDLYAEADETFTLVLSDASNALLGTTSRVVTLQNDDAAPSLSVQDANITEGDNGQMNLVFTVVLSGATLRDVTVDWATADGTAKSSGAIVDFLASNGVVTFGPSAGASQTKTFSVPILGDTWKEDVEQFTVQLSNARLDGNASGVTITDATGDGRIFDNGDAVLGVIIHDARIAEGNSGTTNLQFTIETTASVSGTAITLRADTRVNTANDGDFTALLNRTVTIPVGQSQITLDVPVKGDTVFEATEYFLLDLTGFNADVKAVNGSATKATATGTILNDDVKFAQGSREFQYVDADGDLVTVKFSKGTLRVQGFSSASQTPHVTFSTVNALGGRTLDAINLSISGEEFAFEGVNISMVAKPQILVTGEVLGDGKANVGSLVAATLNSDLFQISSGVGLGKVSIPGNLGVLIAGSTKNPNGARYLELGSFGSDKGSLVLGPIGKMVVHGDFTGNLSLVGDVAARPIPTGGIGRINNLVIGGLLKGGTSDGSGRISFTGGIGKATIGGIEGGSGDASATLVSFSDEFNTRIDSLTVLGDIVGGAGETSALVEADHIGSLTLGKTGKTAAQQVSGSIVGGSGDLSGVVAANTYGNVVINGDLRGGGGKRSGYLVGNVSLGNARITGDVIGGSGEKSGSLEVGGIAQNGTVFVGNAKSITIGDGSASDSGDVVGGSGLESGRIRVTGNLTKFLAYGDIVGGKGTASGSLSFGNNSFTSSLLQSAVIKGSILGGSTDASGTTGAVTSLVGTGFIEAERIGSITVDGDIKSGENRGTALAKSGGIYATDSIGSLKVGSVTGSAAVPVIISALRSIGSVTFGEDVTHLELLAGYTAPDATKTRGVLRDAGASIDSVTVKGTFTASSIVAGVHAGNDGKFGTADDTEDSNGAGTTIGNQDLISRIAKVVINEVGVPTGDATSASYGIVAEYVKSLKVAGSAVALTSGASGDGPSPILPAGSKLQILEIE